MVYIYILKFEEEMKVCINIEPRFSGFKGAQRRVSSVKDAGSTYVPAVR